MEKFLVQKVIDNEVYPKIMTANELIEYIDMADCHMKCMKFLIVHQCLVRSKSCIIKDGSRIV